ncbi:MAG TPA: SUMF1/EgtB/PvdO family nonheme iron enzyme [Sedimentibacter sp.]|nr:SUMF1/EgtB/PvdO family nonheme iron enzyme [Sedimentibacter sp.]
MNKQIKIFFLLLFTIISSALASVDSLYEINGSSFNERNKTKGPKALVKVNHSIGKDVIYSEPDYKKHITQDTIHVSLKKSTEQWLEMEKNSDYFVCVDDMKGGFWKIKDFSYKKTSDSCIQLNSGNYVKSGKIHYATKMGNAFTFNLLIGMKYIDLRGQKHLLGYNNFDNMRLTHNDSNPFLFIDSARNEEINKVLIVDKYKVTECEFIQALWDSIPAQTRDDLWASHNYWVEKKKSIIKNGYCDAHDSAAIRIKPYQALVYANIRSIRDGLKPVYSFEESLDWTSVGVFEDGSFGIKKEFFSFNKNETFVIIHISNPANGYRLPYYDEWMAIARGGKQNYRYVWGNKNDSILASQYAWFGVRDPNDRYLNIRPDFPFKESALKHSCGEWLQESRPVGILKPNGYGLYDMAGLVCENVMLPGKRIFNSENLICKGGFLPDSLQSSNLGSHCDTHIARDFTYQGLRLVRQIK